jgi:hypothetical protein
MQQTVTAPHPVARLEGSLGELRTQIDLVLRSVPDNRLEARRIVTRELGIRAHGARPSESRLAA